MLNLLTTFLKKFIYAAIFYTYKPTYRISLKSGVPRTVSEKKENPPLHFYPYKQRYVINDVLPTPISRDTCGSGY